MNVNAVYLTMRSRYIQDPSWENFFALIGSLLYKFPILSKVPLGLREVEGLINECGLEVCEVLLNACHGLALALSPLEKVRKKLREEIQTPPGVDLIDQDLARKEIFWKLVRHAKQGQNRLILLKAGLEPKVKAYVLAHELGHHLLGHVLEECKVEGWLQEVHADTTAVWLTGLPSPFRSKEENRLIAELVGYDKNKAAAGGSA
ncbi:hypothetical protein G4V39_02345 [Thermosulfuriphilus ammonigenes]|uniref:ImmA/IrrE family metallo-endopeptidase n=1 Tax=Thermosulfuriphilus ammonigenes TaxID=1936021 RepID=A0A6G7PU26_9BACT|nr:ImmA/IrrE family metallo-endopeptidase [Thermosulfuriphilus ammonigenes]MBA2848677.1 hypothetical protein [Thermosulfuriphilus ammonigenes]QIJ71185.1 hypothetical protein G4V39_02345 [Thermosulfuriphilus ammonigenes]